MLRGTPEYAQFISKEVLARLNWILFHLQRKLPKSRADPEERHRRQRKETPQPSKNKLFTNRKKQGEIKPEQMDHGSKEEYSGFEGADTPFSEPVYVDAEVQTDLTASDI